MSGGRGPTVTPLVSRLARAAQPPSSGLLDALAQGRAAAALVRPLFVTEAIAAAPATVAPEAGPPPAVEATGDDAAAATAAALELAREREALAGARAEAEAARRRYLDAVTALAARSGEPRPAPSLPIDEIVDLALMVARELIDREVRADRVALRAAIERGLATVAHDEAQRAAAIIRVSAADLQAWGEHAPEGVVADTALGPGELVIETAEAQLDGRFGPRLEATRAALIAALASTEGAS